ncbi:MAG: hypothetical protein L6Q71_08190, partial [Planctomycetes bacterium]|nr:hypothetical protein [Planctomycetota bacterium]
MSAKNDISEAEYALHDYVSGERLEWPQGLGELARDFDDFATNRERVQTLEIATPVHALKWDKIQARAKQRRSGSRIRRLMPFMGIAASIVVVMGLLSVTISPSLEFNGSGGTTLASDCAPMAVTDGSFVGPPGGGGGAGSIVGANPIHSQPSEAEIWIPFPAEATDLTTADNMGGASFGGHKSNLPQPSANFTNLVRRGSIKLRHDTPSSLQQRIVDSVMASGGAVTQLRRSGTGADTRIAMELSIPSAQFVGFVAALSGMG